MDLLDLHAKKRKMNNSKMDRMRIRESAGGGVFVDNLSEHVVKSPKDILDLLKQGASLRATAQTKLNRESSRSHAVFTVIVEHSTVNVETAAKSVTIGKLNLVDLAGSERVKDSDVQGQQLEEAMKINLSLSAFGKVILALTSPGQQHIPYRDSKLTRILQDSLGGNCKTTLITTITPVSLHYSETINSLKFANRAKSVKNYAMVNEDFSQQAMLSKYEQEIKKLRRALAQQQIGTGSDHLVVREELHRVQSQWAQVTKEKEDVESELAKRLEEVEQTQHEKKKLQQRIEELEKEVLVGGKRPEETPEFEMAVRKAQEQLQNEYESKYRDLEREKEALAKEKEELHAKQQELLTRDRELQSAACNRSSDSPTSDPARSNSPFPEAVSPTGDNSQYWSTGPMRNSWIESDFVDSTDGLYDAGLEPYIRAMKDEETGISLQDHRYNFLTVHDGFTGMEAATWFIENLDGVDSLEHAAKVGQRFLDLGVFVHAGGSAMFIVSDREVFSFSCSIRPPTRTKSARSGSIGGFTPLSRASHRDFPYTASHSTLSRASERDPYSRPTSSILRSDDYPSRLSTPSASMRPSSVYSSSTMAVDTSEFFSEEEWGNNPLHEAAVKGDRSVVKTLIATYGLECTDVIGRTPLMYAVIGNKTKCCELLLRGGADPEAQDINGRTALLWAAYYGHVESAKLLLTKNKSLVDIADPEGRTALHWATKPESPKVIELLSQNCGSEIVNCQDDEQNTALHWSVLCQHPEHTRALLQSCHADPTLADYEGRTAFHYGVSTNSVECVRVTRQLNIHTDMQTVRQTVGQTDRQLDRQTDSWTDRQAGKHRQRDRETDRQTDRHRHTDRLHW
jgi:kinesin family protein 3/17